jgi:tetraacyldisaccharide 4'-kinase
MLDARRLQEIWEGTASAPIALRAGLGAASLAWAAGRRLHRALYATRLLARARLPVPVVSVGNVSVGGSGKTPFVAALARVQVAAGRRVVILARGYGRAHGAALNDEGAWLRSVVPQARIVQAPDRATAARRELAREPADLVLLDDGFQHEALARDLDLVLVDAATGFGNGKLLPAGPLRERPDALRRAAFVVLTRRELASDEQLARTRAAVAAAAPAVPVATTRFEVSGLRRGTRTLPASELRGRAVVIATGVARPAAVAATVAALGARIVDDARFPDHHSYSKGELDDLLARAKSRDAILVGTAKDGVKWSALAAARAEEWLVVEQELVFESGRAELDAALERLITARPATDASAT